MKTNFTRLLLFATLFFTAARLSAQSAGDFRSNFATTGGAWTPTVSVSTWERFDGTTWVVQPNGTYPTAADGVITIQAGDSVVLSGGGSGIAIDQVVIEPGAVLLVFNNISATKPNIANGVGDDIIVNGKMYVAGSGDLSGPGNIHVNAGGEFTLRNSGILAAPTTVDGTLYLGNTGVSAGTIRSTTLTLNGSGTWIDGNANLSTGASFVNNGTLDILTTGSAQWNNTTGPNTFINNGTINKINSNTVTIVTSFTNSATTGIVNVNSGALTFSNSTAGTIVNAGRIASATGTTVTFNNLNNTGTLAGNGTFAFTTATGTNTGTIAPGTSPGILTIASSAITGKTPTLAIEVAGTGNVAGTNNDEVIVPTAVNITGATLNVTNSGTAPAGTVYTIMSATAGTITGPFAAVNIPTNFTVQYNGTNVTLTKIALHPLPVTWGEFKALAQGNRVLLDWTTMMESNTSHFVIEHSTNSSTFTPVANVAAQGNSSYEARYKYTFTTPDLSRTNYFRIKQVDLDGKSTYSLTRSVKFDKGQVVAIQAYPNPVKDVLTLNIQKENIQVLLADQSGKTIQRLNVQPGQHSINMQSLPTGIYQLAIFEGGVRIETKQIMKQ